MVAIAQLVFANLGASNMLTLHVWSDKTFWTAVVLLIVSGTLISGFYPAFVLSGFRPVEVLKGGRYKAGLGAFLRKTLVVFQFAASVALIIGTVIVYQQIRYLKNQDLGVELEKGLVIQAPLLTDSTYLTKSQSG